MRFMLALSPGTHIVSTPDTLFLYVDDPTPVALTDNRARVLLLGGYLGYPNFGDILQLKGAIDWHRRVTGLEPVVLCDLACVTDEQFTARLRAWFRTDAIVYMSDHSIDASGVGLRLFSQPTRAAHLHLYGGGFLNRRWGPRMLRFAELLHARFGVGHYVMSGQQAEEAFIPELREHFHRYPPVLVGGRDEATVAALGKTGVPVAFSFDDAAEQMRLLAASLGARGQPLVSTQHDDSPIAGQHEKRLLVHLNASTYSVDSHQALDELLVRLNRLHSWARTGGGQHRVTLLHAYNDARVRDVSDTLGTVQRLDDRFPFNDYRVLHLGRMAYELGADAQKQSGARTPPVGPTLLQMSARAFTCSYHAAMLCMMQEIPVWLETRNEYYRQKAAGLGLREHSPASPGQPSSPDDFEAFLARPRTVSLQGKIADRARWLERLADAYETAPANACACAGPDIRASDAAKRLVPKGSLVTRAGEKPGLDDTPSTLDDTRSINELQLEDAKRWLESQLAAYKALAETRERSIKELQEWNATLQSVNAALDRDVRTHKARADTLTGDLLRVTNELTQAKEGVKWLEQQYANWQARAKELQAYVEQQQAAMTAADTGRAWLEEQRTAWETTARRHEAELIKLTAWIQELEAAKQSLARDRDMWKAACDNTAPITPRQPG